MLLAASILTSASASTQTTVLPTARTTLSMGVYKALPTSFAKIHRNYLTPSVSTITMGAVSILFYVLFTLGQPQPAVGADRSVGLMIAFYYGLTGFACVWFYRKDLTKNARDFMMRGVVPLWAGLILLVVFIYGLIQYAKPDWLTDDDGNNVTIFGFGAVAVVGIGALVLGVVVMIVWWLCRRTSSGAARCPGAPAPIWCWRRPPRSTRCSGCPTPATCRRSSRRTCRTCRRVRRPSTRDGRGVHQGAPELGPQGLDVERGNRRRPSRSSVTLGAQRLA